MTNYKEKYEQEKKLKEYWRASRFELAKATEVYRRDMKEFAEKAYELEKENRKLKEQLVQLMAANFSFVYRGQDHVADMT